MKSVKKKTKNDLTINKNQQILAEDPSNIILLPKKNILFMIEKERNNFLKLI